MDEGTIKILVYALAILAALVGILASVYKIREAKFRMHAHKLERKEGPPTALVPPASGAPAPTKDEFKAQKKLAKQRAKQIKKSGSA